MGTEISAQGNGRRKQPEGARQALSLMDRIQRLTPREIANMPYDDLREVMILLELDPDEPLPDEIIQLIEKIRR